MVAEYTDISVAFTLTNEVPSNGILELGLAKWNQGTQTIGLESSSISYTIPDDEIGANLYNIPCSATSGDLISCSFEVAPVTTIEGISTSRDLLKVSGFTSALAAGTTFTFQTTGSRFRNPPTTKTISSYTARTMDASGNEIDSYSTKIVYENQVTEAALMLSDQVTIRATTGEINQEQVYTFTVTLPIPLPVGAEIELVIPTEVSIYSDDARSNLILLSAQGQGNLFSSPRVEILDTTTQ